MMSYADSPSRSARVGGPIAAGLGAALIVAVVAYPQAALSQGIPSMLYEGASIEAVTNALYERCYDAGMTVEPLEGDTIVCSTTLEGDAQLPDDVVVADVHEGRAYHRIRFALAERADGIRVWAYPRIEIVEAEGVVIEDEIRSESYLARVQVELARVEQVLAAGGDAAREPWADHYESEHAWRLDAHLRAVEHCDTRLEALDPERIGRLLERAGVRPMSQNLRGHCEELYEPVFRWGLARGIEEPTVEDYVEYRAALPPAERCTGQLALGAASCE